VEGLDRFSARDAVVGANRIYFAMMEVSKMGMEQCLDKMAASFAQAWDAAS
jgi:hypothetical protein